MCNLKDFLPSSVIGHPIFYKNIHVSFHVILQIIQPVAAMLKYVSDEKTDLILES